MRVGHMLYYQHIDVIANLLLLHKSECERRGDCAMSQLSYVAHAKCPAIYVSGDYIAEKHSTYSFADIACSVFPSVKSEIDDGHIKN